MESYGKKSSNNQVHFILIPFLAPGHMNPMVDLGKLLAERGVLVTIITTPQNLNRFKSTIDHALHTGLPLRFHTIQIFRSTDGGRQENCENLDSLVSVEAVLNFFSTTDLLEEPVKMYLKELTTQEDTPLCIISDSLFLLWTSKIAMELNIPRLVFYGIPCFTLTCIEILKGYEENFDLKKPFVIPEIPHRIELNREQTYVFHERWKKADSFVDGIIVNSSTDIDTTYVDIYKTKKVKPIWTVGPVVLCNKDVDSKVTRGLNSSSMKWIEILTFLDSMDRKSVVYVSLGSLSRTSLAQLVEICMGLMDTTYPFIFVVQMKNNLIELESWFENTKFEERTKDRGLVIRGCAPQVMILSHPSLGGFVTHCGWNSCLEGISAGIPMVTWPCFADQFFNERLLIDVLKIGVEVGSKEYIWYWEEIMTVKREEFSKAINELMGSGEEATARRRRALELSKMVDKAMDVGGSSDNNLNSLIQQVFSLVEEKKNEG